MYEFSSTYSESLATVSVIWRVDGKVVPGGSTPAGTELDNPGMWAARAGGGAGSENPCWGDGAGMRIAFCEGGEVFASRPVACDWSQCGDSISVARSHRQDSPATGRRASLSPECFTMDQPRSGRLRRKGRLAPEGYQRWALQR